MPSTFDASPALSRSWIVLRGAGHYGKELLLREVHNTQSTRRSPTAGQGVEGEGKMTMSKNMNKRVLTYFYIVVGFVLMLTVSGCTDYQAGEDAYNRGDYETAFKKFLPLAEQGDARAQVYLGLLYEKGNGVPQNDTEAVKWFRLAADQGKAYAQSILGEMYLEGKGVPQNDTKAVKWFRLAAVQGYMDGQTYLGRMLEKGKGVPQDFAEAMKWFRLAAAQGNASAQNELGRMYEKGNGVPQNDTEAVKWFRLAADQKKAHAQSWLGYMYENGKGVSQDYVLALMWLNLAVAQGDADSAKRVEKLEKEMTPEQIAEAQRLAREWKPKGK